MKKLAQTSTLKKKKGYCIKSPHFMANGWGNSDRLYFLGFQNHYGWWLSHEIKEHLLLGKKAMTNLDSILKSRDITLLTKVCLVKTLIFFRNHVWMWELDHTEGRVPNNWCFQTVVLDKTLETPLECKDIKPVNPKGNQSWISLEWLMLKWSSNTLVTWCKELTHWKRAWCWERLKTRE